jgi:hypothetical protein
MANKKTVAENVAAPAVRTFGSWKSVLLVKSKSGLPHGTKIHMNKPGEFQLKDKAGNVLYTGSVDDFAKKQFVALGFAVK